MMENTQITCCFIGHRKIAEPETLRTRLRYEVEQLIRRGVVQFVFGDRSEFNDLCYEVVTELQETYPRIRRIQFRVTYPVVDAYTLRLVQGVYDESYFPEEIRRAGRAAYVERNRAMIRASQYCVFYYDPLYTPQPRRRTRRAASQSGTRLAYQYAQQTGKIRIDLYPPPSADEVR